MASLPKIKTPCLSEMLEKNLTPCLSEMLEKNLMLHLCNSRLGESGSIEREVQTLGTTIRS